MKMNVCQKFIGNTKVHRIHNTPICNAHIALDTQHDIALCMHNAPIYYLNVKEGISLLCCVVLVVSTLRAGCPFLD